MIKKLIDKYNALPVQMRASLWFLACAFLQKGIGIITTPIFTRLMTPSEYGAYNVFVSWMGIIEVFVTLKISSGSYVQGLVKFDDKKKEYTSALLGLTVTMVLIWTCIYLLTSAFWNHLFNLNTTQMLLMMTILMMDVTMSFWATRQRVDYKYIKLVIVTILGTTLKAALGIVLVLYAKDKVTARIFSTALTDVLVCTALFFSIFYEGKKVYHKVFWKYILKLNIPLIPHYLAGNILNTADRIMISGMVGESRAGIYSLAYSVSLIMTIFNQAVLQTLEPWIYKRIKKKEFYRLNSILFPSLIGVAGLNILLIAFAPEVIKIFAPPEYYEAIYAVPPIAMGVYFQFMYVFFAPFEFYYEKTSYITIATFFGAAVNVILNAIFIRICGYVAAGYTTLLCYILFAFMHYIFMKKICRLNLNDIVIFNENKLLAFSIFFLTLGLSFVVTYHSALLRYSVVGILVIACLIKKEECLSIVRNLMMIREEGRNANE